MARPLGSKILVEGRLVTLTPLSIGGVDDHGVDLALAVNGSGKHYVPGTSLAGPLRDWARRNLRPDLTDRPDRQDRDGSLVAQVFGYQGKPGTTAGHASWLTIGDGEILGLDGQPVELRDGVGIDRRTGAAAHGIRFERQVLPPSTAIELRLELDLPPAGSGQGFKAADAEALLRLLLDALRDGEIRLGGAKTRGLGRVKLDGEPTVRRYDLGANRSDLFRWLRDRDLSASGPSAELAEAEGFLDPPPRLEVEVRWHPLTPVLVKSGVEGEGVDSLPLVGTVGGGEVAAVLPGSSVKGALRSHAERIARTLQGPPPPAPAGFLDQLAVPVVEDLFGSAGRAGWLSVPDVYQEGRRLSAEDFREERLDGWGRHEDHVAIDRFTGGAAESLLFSLHTPPDEPGAWAPLRLELELPRNTAGGRAPAALALLLLTVRDLAAGRVPLGFGTNRGLGAVSVDSVTLTPKAIPELPDSIVLTPGMGYTGLDQRQSSRLIDALHAALEARPSSPAGETTS